MAVRAAEAAKAGQDSLARGTLALVGAQFALMAGGYVIHFYLGRKLGPASYGTFGVVFSYLIWLEVSLIGGFPYAIRKFGAERADLMPAIARAAAKGQILYSAALFAAAVAAAPWAARLLRDPSLTSLIRLASLDIPVFAFYFCCTAVLNGRRNYTRQAAAMLTYTAAKVGAVMLLVALGFGVRGALVGNILASVGGLAAAAFLTGRLPKAPTYPVRKLARYAGATAVQGVLFTLLITVDIFVVKALAPGSSTVGYYTAAGMLARAPFYVLTGIATATLPAISRAASDSDWNLVRRYTSQGLRLQLAILGLVTALLAGTADRAIVFVYSHSYAPGATSLAILAVGLTFFGLLSTLYNVLVAIGDVRTPLVGTTVLIIIATALSVALVPRVGVAGAAAASAATAAAGLSVTAVACARRLGKTVSPATVTRTTAASALVYAAARTAAVQRLDLLFVYSALLALYATVLVVSGEIHKADVAGIASAVGLGRSRPPAHDGSGGELR